MTLTKRYRASYGPRNRYTDEQRIGACADYLLGLPHKVIAAKWGVRMESVYVWIKRTGSFKTRNTHAKLEPHA
jgi:uncharacterized protein YjcR